MFLLKDHKNTKIVKNRTHSYPKYRGIAKIPKDNKTYSCLENITLSIHDTSILERKTKCKRGELKELSFGKSAHRGVN